MVLFVHHWTPQVSPYHRVVFLRSSPCSLGYDLHCSPLDLGSRPLIIRQSCWDHHHDSWFMVLFVHHWTPQVAPLLSGGLVENTIQILFVHGFLEFTFAYSSLIYLLWGHSYNYMNYVISCAVLFCSGWLGVKHQFTYLLTHFFLLGCVLLDPCCLECAQSRFSLMTDVSQEISFSCSISVGWVLLYVHRNHRAY